MAEYGYMGFNGGNKSAQNTRIVLKSFSREAVVMFEKGNFDFRRGFCLIRPLEFEGIRPAILRTGVFRELEVPEAEIRISGFETEHRNVKFTLSAGTFAHGVHFADMEKELRYSDEYFDLLPGEVRQITAYDAAGIITPENMPKCISVKGSNNL